MNILSPNVFEEVAEQFGLGAADAFMKEIQTGIALEQGKTKQHVNKSAEVHYRTSKAIDGMGYIASDIPADVWHSWNQKYPGCWNDKTFRQNFLSKHPQFRVKYQKKIQTGYQPRTRNGLFIGSKYGAVTA